MAKSLVIETVKVFARQLKQNNIDVEKVFLYGSQVGECSDEGSDIDVAVVSGSFGQDYFEELKTLMRIARSIDLAISPKPYSLEEYQSASPGDFLWQEIIRKGQEIDVS